jgi:hypothetical protein
MATTSAHTLRVGRLCILFVHLVAGLPALSAAEAVTVNEALWSTDGEVNALVTDGTTVYVGGNSATSARSPALASRSTPRVVRCLRIGRR